MAAHSTFYRWLCPILLLAASSCSQYNPRVVDNMSPAQLRRELRQTEGLSPGEYLHVEGTSRRNLIDQLVLEGTVTNAASAAAYDVVLTVDWLDRAGQVLDTKYYRLDKRLKPGQQTPFKLKTVAPSQVASVGMGGNESDYQDAD
ncbi:MAG: FxLYD domain-containing protein [Janthinobacterium lividum]